MQNGTKHLCLTDFNAINGIPEHFREAQQYPELPVCSGIHFRAVSGKGPVSGTRCMYMGIARNGHGFAELNRFLSRHQLSGEPLPETAPEFEHTFVVYPFERALEKGFKTSLSQFN